MFHLRGIINCFIVIIIKSTNKSHIPQIGYMEFIFCIHSYRPSFPFFSSFPFFLFFFRPVYRLRHQQKYGFLVVTNEITIIENLRMLEVSIPLQHSHRNKIQTMPARSLGTPLLILPCFAISPSPAQNNVVLWSKNLDDRTIRESAGMLGQ